MEGTERTRGRGVMKERRDIKDVKSLEKGVLAERREYIKIIL